jgi:hypothetical protein
MPVRRVRYRGRGGDGTEQTSEAPSKINKVPDIATQGVFARVNQSRETAQKFVGAPEVTLPFLMCVVLFLLTIVVYAIDDTKEDDDGDTHKSFTTYVITMSMIAMNISAALSFAIFQKNLENVHLYGFCGIAVASLLFWVFLVYEASQLVS